MEHSKKAFDSCPNCGSKERFIGGLAEVLRKKGYGRAIWDMFYNVSEGPVIDQAWEARIPVGAEVPTFGIKTDICSDCGTVYAIELVTGSADKQVVPPKLHLPPGAGRKN